MRMLVPAPYQAPTKKDKKKKREESTSDTMSADADAQSSHEGDDDDELEEEEEDPPRKGKKRAASEDLEAEASKRDKITIPDDSGWMPRLPQSTSAGLSPKPTRKWSGIIRTYSVNKL